MADDKGQTNGPTLTHSQSVNRLKEITSELERLGELDELTPEDETYFGELRDEFKSVDKHRKKLERDAELAAVRSASQGIGGFRIQRGAPGNSADQGERDAILEPDSVEDRRFRNPWDLSEVRTFGRSRESVNEELRSRALSAIEKMPSANDKVREAATTIVERFDDKDATLARLALVASSPAYLRAFAKAATNRLHELDDTEQRALQAVRAMSLTDSAGGYLVPFQLDPTVIITANGSLNEIRRIARQVVATGDTWNGVSAGAVAWSWDAEATQVSDDAPTFAQPSIPVYKAAGFVPVSIEALQDMANGAAEVARLLSEGREILEAAAFVTGSGVGQPTGIVTALTGTGSVVASAGADTLAVGDLYNVQGSLPARYRARASWLATNAFYNRARQFDTAGGSSLWAQLGDDRPANLLGKPIYEAEDMDGVITAAADNYMAVFGDFSNYVIADRIGMTVEFIPHLFGTTNGRPTGQRGWYAYYRTGADSVNDGAFRLLNVT
ncbi:phage major capsid protein [Micromonospora sp. L32]|uniref:phage major capsid protein n=1 Tax=Micromonospora sp. L32 TaxID=3452214 RepID=UPI003F89941B